MHPRKNVGAENPHLNAMNKGQHAGRVYESSAFVGLCLWLQ